jgi:hypothetical protein
VTAGQQRRQGLVDHLVLTEDHLSDGGTGVGDGLCELIYRTYLRRMRRISERGDRPGGHLSNSFAEVVNRMAKRVHHSSIEPAVLRARIEAAERDAGKAARDRTEGRAVYDSLGIRIDRDGVWYYHGSPIHRKELVCLFASALRRDADGRYWLITPSEIVPIEVDDAPFIVVEMFVGGRPGKPVISFRTNVDEVVTVSRETPIYVVCDAASGEPSPYVKLPEEREARLCRSVYYELVDLAEEAELGGVRRLGVWSDGVFFPLGPAGDPDDGIEGAAAAG